MADRTFIVLHTKGKNEAVDFLKIKLFDNRFDAEKYCKENTDEEKDKKYWNYCEIINEGRDYEPARYKNFG
jgi:hypothetical protein